MTSAAGTNACSNSSRFAPKVACRIMIPVTLPVGRFRLVTKPVAIGSLPITNTVGIASVADFAASAAGLKVGRQLGEELLRKPVP
jgi:hypothetical protein